MSVRTWLSRERRRQSATREGFPWFRAGYAAAIHDMERTGLRPMSPQTIRESADRALSAWIEDPSASSRKEPSDG